MDIVFVAALLASSSDPAALPAIAEVRAPVAEAPTIEAKGCVDDSAAYRHAHAVLEGYAGQGRGERAAIGVGAGVLAAGMIGTAITYVAVGKVDVQLGKIDAEDTQLAGWVIGGAALIPAAIMVVQIVTTSNEEQRLAEFEAAGRANASDSPKARIDAAKASLATEAAALPLLPIASGSALIAGALGSAGIGGYFILLPHLANPRGIVSHGTGAELVGAGVGALGVGIALIATSGSTASEQLELLGEGEVQ